MCNGSISSSGISDCETSVPICYKQPNSDFDGTRGDRMSFDTLKISTCSWFHHTPFDIPEVTKRQQFVIDSTYLKVLSWNHVRPIRQHNFSLHTTSDHVHDCFACRTFVESYHAQLSSWSSLFRPQLFLFVFFWDFKGSYIGPIKRGLRKLHYGFIWPEFRYKSIENIYFWRFSVARFR